MESKLQIAFVEALGIDPEGTDWSTLRYRGIPEWDSVAHMQLVAEIEDSFDIMLETDDVIRLSSFEVAQGRSWRSTGLPMSEGPFLDLRGKVAVVTGGSRGIGRACARALATEGVGLAVLGRVDSPALRETCHELGGGAQVLPIACDAADPEQIRAAYRLIHAEFGRLDILVNNAGVLDAAPLGMVSDESVARLLKVNVAGPILHLQAAARLMRRTGGSIVNMTSIMGVQGAAGYAVYSASKAAVIGLIFLGGQGIGASGDPSERDRPRADRNGHDREDPGSRPCRDGRLCPDGPGGHG